MLKKTLCKVLTLGRHWWVYGCSQRNQAAHIECGICGYYPPDQWVIYEKKFLGKPEGRYFSKGGKND